MVGYRRRKTIRTYDIKIIKLKINIMKELITFFIFVLIVQQSFSQISATTTTGKKVTLNNDGTWVYSDGLTAGTSIDNDCEKNEYGEFNFHNNTDKDIYVVVAKNSFERFRFKISAGKSKLLKSVKIVKPGFNNDRYSYKVLLEEPMGDVQYDRLSYKTNGDIYVKVCQTVDVNIDDF